MGIRFHCHNCTKKLHVKTFLAGKRGVCPHCGGSVRIPLESTVANGQRADPHGPTIAISQQAVGASSVAEQAATEQAATEQAATDAPAHVQRPQPSSSAAQPVVRSQPQRPARVGDEGQPNSRMPWVDPIAESPESVWYVQPPSGGQFGPARGDVFQRWIREGRVGAESYVWREDWPNWRRAGDVLPQLATAPAAPPPVEGAHRLGTNSNETGQPPAFDVPLPAPSDTVPAARRRRRRSNAPTIAVIVTLCIISLVLLVALLIVLVGGVGS